jgi:hypothetical protein
MPIGSVRGESYQLGGGDGQRLYGVLRCRGGDELLVFCDWQSARSGRSRGNPVLSTWTWIPLSREIGEITFAGVSAARDGSEELPPAVFIAAPDLPQRDSNLFVARLHVNQIPG